MSAITKPIMLDETGQAIVTQLQRASALQGPKGDPGDDYVLTAQDKEDIAEIVLTLLPSATGVSF